jgi:Ca2+-binding EF-hand superfamily protein
MHRSLLALLLIAAAGAQAGGHGGQRHGLDQLDSDADGLISDEEFSQLPARGGRDPSAAFERLDSNADGYLDADELEAGRQRASQRRGGRGTGARFDELDSDGDGQLSAEELSALPTRGEVTAEQRFDHLDTNTDGYVSRDELHEAARRGPRPE